MTKLPPADDVLEYWLGDTPRVATDLKARNKLWFGKSKAADAEIKLRFGLLIDTLSAGPLAEAWARGGARARLAAIIALDQFSRNIFRNSPRSFAQDALALRLCKEGLLSEDDVGLSETERIFFYLPLEHSEIAGDQIRSVELFQRLHRDARADWQNLTQSTLTYAESHKAVIDRFGRFPHRNALVGRISTAEEQAWLAAGGGF
jgi:uncharacterized protein (DUF924 family)